MLSAPTWRPSVFRPEASSCRPHTHHDGRREGDGRRRRRHRTRRYRRARDILRAHV